MLELIGTYKVWKLAQGPPTQEDDEEEEELLKMNDDGSL